jgi:nucleotidyltransferase/DNA polymerase involved in DNA repair
MGVVQYNPFGDLKTLRPTDDRTNTSNGSLIAVSYEARAKGVKRIMRGKEAREKCPDMILIQVPTWHGKADLTLYREAGNSVVKVLSSVSCTVEKASIDEVYLDLTEEVDARLQEAMQDKSGILIEKLIEAASVCMIGGQDEKELQMHKINIRNGHAGSGHSSTENTTTDATSIANILANDVEFGNGISGDRISFYRWSNDKRRLVCGAAIVAELRQLVFERLGFTCSAGIAPNKMLAKIGSGMHKPNKQTLMPSSIVEMLMSKMPISRVPGFGGKLGDTLSSLPGKVETFGDLNGLDRRLLIDRFGEETTARMLNAARGIDNEPVKERSLCQSIGCGKSFTYQKTLHAEDMLNGVIQKWLTELGAELAERVQNDSETNHRRPKNLTVAASFNGSRNIKPTGTGGRPVSSISSEGASGKTAVVSPGAKDNGKLSSALAHSLSASPSLQKTIAPVSSPGAAAPQALKVQPPGATSSTHIWAATAGVSMSKVGPYPSKPEAVGKTAFSLLQRIVQQSSKLPKDGWSLEYLQISASVFEQLAAQGSAITSFFKANSSDVNSKQNAFHADVDTCVPKDVDSDPETQEEFPILHTNDDWQVPKEANGKIPDEVFTPSENVHAALPSPAIPFAHLLSDRLDGGQDGRVESNSETVQKLVCIDDEAETDIPLPQSIQSPCKSEHTVSADAIDLDVFNSLPPEVQEELRRAYPLSLGSKAQQKPDTSTFFVDNSGVSSPGQKRILSSVSMTEMMNAKIRKRNGIERFFGK